MPFTEQALAEMDAALSEGSEMAAFHGDTQLTEWQPYRPGVGIEMARQTLVTHVALRRGDDIVCAFPLDQSGHWAPVPVLAGDTVAPPPQPWMVNWSEG